MHSEQRKSRLISAKHRKNHKQNGSDGGKKLKKKTSFKYNKQGSKVKASA